MLRETRLMFNQYVERIAELNGVRVEDVAKSFNIAPAVAQTMEKKIREKSDFLSRINHYSVTEMSGEKIGLGVSGTIASRTDTAQNSRQTNDVSDMTADGYKLVQTNFDTHISYDKLDAWSAHPEFQIILSDSILEAIAADRVMIGFNGTHAAKTTKRSQYPLLEDVNEGWLHKIRTKAPERNLKTTDDGEEVVRVGKGQKYENLDAVVYDAIENLLAPRASEDRGLVVIIGRRLLHDKYFGIINRDHSPSEMLSTDLILANRSIGGLPAYRVPSMSPKSLLITTFDNLSIYTQRDKHRRHIKEVPERDRIETYQSINEAYVVEDYERAALVDNIEFAE